MSNKQVIRDILVQTVRRGMPAYLAADFAPKVWMQALVLHPWALCYGEPFEGNPYHRDAQLLDAIIRLGDRCCDELPHGDEWSHFAWLEAMAAVRDQLDDARRARWERCLRSCADYTMARCIDMDTFDGCIPNHGIWSHVYVHRAGQVFDVPEYREMAQHAMGRVLGAQTADGVWCEWQTAALMPGSPVTGYNLVSAAAVNVYYGHSGDPRAADAVDRAWRWFYDFLLPDGSMPPNFDCRQAYYEGEAQPFIARWWSIPEGRWLGMRGARKLLDRLRSDTAFPGLGLQSFQFPLIEEEGEEREPAWPEYSRMVLEPACVRRRNGWAAALSGMTNYGNSSCGVRMFVQERQDCVALAHADAGLLIGSAHSLAQPDFSTFVFFQDGAADYLPRQAYLKSTPPLDTLLLRYGDNVGAVSVDTTRAEHCDILFSLHGERGRSPQRGHGHPISAMCARAHLCARVHPGDAIALGGESWTAEADDRRVLRLDVPAGQALSLGRFTLTCLEAPWEFRWPLRTRNPYTVFGPGEWLGVAEVILYDGGSGDPPPAGQPTATFRVVLDRKA